MSMVPEWLEQFTRYLGAPNYATSIFFIVIMSCLIVLCIVMIIIRK